MRSLEKFAQGASAPLWAAASALANLLAITLTTVVVTLLVADPDTTHRVLYGLLGVAMIGLTAWLTAVATRVREAQFPKHPSVVLDMLRALSAAGRRENELRRELQNQPSASKRRATALLSLKTYLAALEGVLSDAWSRDVFGAATPVEVVLMKRAADGEVTVACWATSRPTSLDQRRTKPAFYTDTEAAKLYRKYVDKSVRSPILLIPDISKYESYDHFGRDPRLRTNSTALFPLYDMNSACHGFVAATARNQAGMFREDDREFWNEAWRLWETDLLRCIVDYEATGQLLDEESA